VFVRGQDASAEVLILIEETFDGTKHDDEVKVLISLSAKVPRGA